MPNYFLIQKQLTLQLRQTTIFWVINELSCSAGLFCSFRIKCALPWTLVVITAEERNMLEILSEEKFKRVQWERFTLT